MPHKRSLVFLSVCFKTGSNSVSKEFCSFRNKLFQSWKQRQIQCTETKIFLHQRQDCSDVRHTTQHQSVLNPDSLFRVKAEILFHETCILLKDSRVAIHLVCMGVKGTLFSHCAEVEPDKPKTPQSWTKCDKLIFSSDAPADFGMMSKIMAWRVCMFCKLTVSAKIWFATNKKIGGNFLCDFQWGSTERKDNALQNGAHGLFCVFFFVKNALNRYICADFLVLQMSFMDLGSNVCLFGATSVSLGGDSYFTCCFLLRGLRGQLFLLVRNKRFASYFIFCIWKMYPLNCCQMKTQLSWKQALLKQQEGRLSIDAVSN